MIIDGQTTIFDIDTRYFDKTYDRRGQSRKAPKWYSYERCENCDRWNRADEQPPDGWGIKGFCANHLQMTTNTGYCQYWEDKRKLKEQKNEN